MCQPGLLEVVKVSLCQRVPEKQPPRRLVRTCHGCLSQVSARDKRGSQPAHFVALSRLLLLIKCRFIEGDSSAGITGGDEPLGLPIVTAGGREGV